MMTNQNNKREYLMKCNTVWNSDYIIEAPTALAAAKIVAGLIGRTVEDVKREYSPVDMSEVPRIAASQEA